MNRSPSGRAPRPYAWLAATLVLAVAFVAVIAVPRVSADPAASSDERRYPLIIQNVFDFILRHYVDEVDPEKLYEGAMKGMFESLNDPYSVFLSASDMMDMNDTTQGSFGGVGLYITKPTEPGPNGEPPYVEVASPIEDTPGWRSGIMPGDLILEIDGSSTADLTMDEVLAKLRGEPGTDVKVQIRRGEKVVFTVDLTRAVIEVPTVKSSMIGDDIGYLRIITFTPNTAERVRDAIDTFDARGYKGIVVDLRNNYGGLLQAAIDVLDYFLPGGTVVSTKSRIPGENATYTAHSRIRVPAELPVVVLINRASASASEIVAGALKDRGRAYLVGEKSYGKGSVQQIYPIDGTGFKITTSRYYTPSDVNIDKIGIPPDLQVKFPELSDAQSEALGDLLSSGAMRAFVRAHSEPAGSPEASQGTPAPKGTVPPQEDVDRFVAELQKQYGLSSELLHRLVRDEVNRTAIAPVYDIDYDVQLQAAVGVLRDGSWATKMKSVKTLKVLQEEAAAATAEGSPSGSGDASASK